MPDENYVIPATGNGGFPLPAPGGKQRLVEATHAGCAKTTRVFLPAVLPLRAVRRFVCDHCERIEDAAQVLEVRPSLGRRLRAMMPSLPGSSAGAPARPAALPSVSVPSPSMPSRIDPRWLTLPVAALAVFAILSLVNGDESPAPSPTSTAAPESAAKAPVDAKKDAKADNAAKNGGTAKASVPADAQLVAESTYSLALPAGWDRVKPGAGATFAAVSADGTADATLWIQSDPKLDMATFEASSLEQLKTLAGSAEVTDRKIGPSVESSTIVLAPKDVPEGAPTYEVVLRGAGDNWYYLATTHQAGAPADALAGVDLIQGSFLPLGGKG
jgi:hypothetical protein